MSPISSNNDDLNWFKVFSNCIERTKANITKKIKIPETQFKQIELTRSSLGLKVPEIRNKYNDAKDKRVDTETKVRQAEQNLKYYEEELERVYYFFE